VGNFDTFVVRIAVLENTTFNRVRQKGGNREEGIGKREEGIGNRQEESP
jgi:hypothetical protein